MQTNANDVEREEQILDAKNLGAFYKFVNSKIGNSSGLGPLHDKNGNFIFDDKAKAELLNQYFHSVFISDNGILPQFPSRFKTQNLPNLNDITFDTPDIIKILNKLKTNSAAGPDDLPPIFYNKTAKNIAYPIKQLFRTFIDSRTLPQEWKNSIITPKFKKGVTTDPANYRPIALTCSVCKVLESLITSSLIQFLTDHDLISHSQHGFLKKHSTTTNLLTSLRYWTISLSNHKSTHICYIDFQRAFDTISHIKLIHKLASYGISYSSPTLRTYSSGSKLFSAIVSNVFALILLTHRTYLSSVQSPRGVYWGLSSSIFSLTIFQITFLTRSENSSQPHTILVNSMAAIHLSKQMLHIYDWPNKPF